MSQRLTDEQLIGLLRRVRAEAAAVTDPPTATSWVLALDLIAVLEELAERRRAAADIEERRKLGYRFRGPDR